MINRSLLFSLFATTLPVIAWRQSYRLSMVLRKAFWFWPTRSRRTNRQGAGGRKKERRRRPSHLGQKPEVREVHFGHIPCQRGRPTFIDSAHAIAHNKVMVIDKSTVITGSFNFTKAAEEKNAENLLVINRAPELAQTYTANWKVHRGHAELLPTSNVPYASTSPALNLSAKASTR